MRKDFHSGTALIGLFGLWLVLYSTWGMAIETPPMPFVAEGECVGEKCTYRTEFIALVDTVARINHRDESPVAFQIRKGQRFYGIDSAVITNHPGILKVLKTCRVGGYTARVGDRIFLLYYTGEGTYQGWFRGGLVTIALDLGVEPEHVGCFQDTNDRPAFTWRIKVVDAVGKQGWVDSDVFLRELMLSSVLEADWLSLRRDQSALEFSYGHDGVLTVSHPEDIYRIRVPAFRRTGLPPDRLLVSASVFDCTLCGYFLIACAKASEGESCLDVYRIDRDSVNPPYVATPKQVVTAWFAPPFVLFLEQERNEIYRIDTRTGESRRLQFLNLRTGYFPVIAADAVSLSSDKRQINLVMKQGCYSGQQDDCRDELKTSHVMSVNVATWEAREVAKQFTDIGWSNDTGHKHAETPQQHAIVAAAMNIHEASPQSIATGNAVIWQTDTEGGDGKRMRDAIQVVYDYWSRSGRPALPFVAPLPTSVQNEMRARLRATYSQTEQSAFIAQITSVFNGTVPGTDNETLQYLGIRAQCKEFADRIVQAGGGKTHTYSEGKALAVNPEDIRPGMYAFKKDSSHAAIIIAVKWDANGQATDLRLAEANMGPGWTNPKGQVPWKRGVKTREVPVSEFFVVPTD